MLRSIAGTIGLCLIAACGFSGSQKGETAPNTEATGISISATIDKEDRTFRAMPPGVPRKHTVGSAKKARSEICMRNGGAKLTCDCRANASATALPTAEFLEETRYIESQNFVALEDFHNRLRQRRPDIARALSLALSECPAMVLELG